ncbi:unnamed protein product [Larinioides sclopetarius]|uniref:Uncharacterized protein n=1 Tax=Larinioides sclopetarius TaxID=280406 RepID=A0AAV2BMT7_9ARAC
MTNKNRGKKERNESESNFSEASKKDNNTKGENAMTTSGVTLKTRGSSENSQALENTPPSMGKKKNNVKSPSVTYVAKQFHVEVSKNNDKNSTGMGSGNLTPHSQEAAQLAEDSKQKRSNRNKSITGTSRTEALSSAGCEGYKPASSKKAIDEVLIQKLVAARILAIESGATEAKSIKNWRKHKIQSPHSWERKLKTNFITENEIVPSSYGETQAANQSKIQDSIKPSKKIGNSFVFTQKTARASEKKETLANHRQNMLQKEREEKENEKFKSDIHTAMPLNAQESKNENKKATGKDSDNLSSLSPEVALLAKKSKKRKRRKKSVPNTSGIESLAGTEYEGRKLDISPTHFDKDADLRELVDTQILVIKSGINGPKIIKHIDKYKIASYPSQKGKQIINTEDENAENSSNEDQLAISGKEIKTDNSIRPAIFVTDKFTQTDPIQEPSNISEHIKNNSALILDSESKVIAEAAVSDLLLLTEESNPKNVSEDIDPSEIFNSNLSSFDQNLQSIREDFLRDLKITNEKFKNEFINCLKNEK